MKIVIFLSGVLTAFWALTGCQTQQTNAPTSLLVPAKAGMVTPDIPAKTVSIVDFGAVGDGKTYNTDAFAKAIDSVRGRGRGACDCAGGDVVYGADPFAEPD